MDKKKIDCVVINSHANPMELSWVNIDDVLSLKKKM